MVGRAVHLNDDLGSDRRIEVFENRGDCRQSRVITEKQQPRKLRAGIYAQSGELISDAHEVVFDFASENPRERELPLRFILSRKADDFNNQQVELRLEKPVDGTTHFSPYKAERYTILRAFTGDVDF